MIPPCLTPSNIRYVSRVKWRNPGKWLAASPTPWCSSDWKGSLLVVLDHGRQLFTTFLVNLCDCYVFPPRFGFFVDVLVYIYIYIYTCIIGHSFRLSSCRILFVLSETWRSIQASCRFLLLSVPSWSSSSLVNTLSVNSCWKWSLFRVFYNYSSFSLWSSIRVWLLILGIYPAAEPVCFRWTRIVKPRFMYVIMAWRFPIWYFIERCS